MIGRPFVSMLALLRVALVWVLAAGAGLAWSQDAAPFDHLSTGFALTGAHGSVRCESCHQDGVLKGTPRECASCHVGGQRLARGNVVMPAVHVQSSLGCDSCHGTKSFAGARFAHQGVAAGSCASCHNGTRAGGVGPGHLSYTSVPGLSSASCDTCHRGGTASWQGAKVHAAANLTGGCASCHSGSVAGITSKPATPIHAGVTACESCHGTGSWSGAKVDHAGFGTSTNCAQCHNGTSAVGKSSAHMPAGSAGCSSCHATSAWKPARWNHSQIAVAGQCASCHTGGYPPADGRSASHVPYASVAATASANCDSCHKSGYASWTPAKVHSNATIASQCATCHTGGFPPAAGKPSNAIHAGVSGNCESCHKSTSNWSSAKVDHSGFNASTDCASCHNGSTATGKSSSHMPVGSTSCFSCHSTSGWAPSKWNHTQVTVASACASCHTGGYPPADGRPANHVPYASVAATASANCDSCHKSSYANWTPAKVHSNATIASQCASCHTGAFPPAEGKPSNAIHAGVSGNCESCHKSTSNWSSAKVDHSGFGAATNCASCHNGSTATGKSASHIPVGATSCFSCHGTTGWIPTKWNHTQLTVTAQCAGCHSGGYPPADGRPGNHIPYLGVAVTASANCDACHKGSTATWANGRLHTNFSIATGCVSCHSGSYLGATGKPGNALHATITGGCESCHRSTSSWSSVTFAHSAANAVGTGTCDTCHNGSTATGKPASHIPVPAGAARCDSCHKSQASFKSSVTMNHTVVASGSCKSCHNASYTGAGLEVKPGNHIPELQLLNGSSMDCNACHTSTSGWGSAKMNHNNSQGSGAGWCKACHQSGTSYDGVGEKKPLTHEKSTGVVDCSQAGCHRPLGTKGTTFKEWD